jgi:hypothetical protein
MNRFICYLLILSQVWVSNRLLLPWLLHYLHFEVHLQQCQLTYGHEQDCQASCVLDGQMEQEKERAEAQQQSVTNADFNLFFTPATPLKIQNLSNPAFLLHQSLYLFPAITLVVYQFFPPPKQVN